MEKRDYYEVLDVARDADDKTIKKSYRKQAMQWHPDRNPGDQEAEERFKEAAEAYEVLSDTEKRSVYDRYGHQGLKRSGFGGGAGNAEDIFSHFSDIFGDFFGFGGGGRRRRRGVARGADLRYNLEIDFEEAVFGTKQTIEVPRSIHCSGCDGAGSEDGSAPEVCRTCGGNGQVYHTQGFFSIATTCPDCRGRGKVISKPCKVCKGSGREVIERRVAVRIPGGVDTGAKLRLRGEGESSTDREGPPGDLYVVIHVRPHERFQRDGIHLFLSQSISFAQAALGAEIEIKTLDGEETLQVKAGTQPGADLIIEGAGVPMIEGQGRGHLVVKLDVEIPAKLSKRQRELLEEFATESGIPFSPKEGFFSKLKKRK